MTLVDHALSCRLERAEANANARFVEARARLFPDSGAEWIEVAGTYAMYDGPRSPCTQTFGLGMFQMPTPTDMEAIEAFFQNRKAPVFHEVSPIADKALLQVLHERGYRPVELSNVMFLPFAGRVPQTAATDESMRVLLVGPENQDQWMHTALEGWRELIDFADLFDEMMQVSAAREHGASFLVERDGAPIAAGALELHKGIALMAGACTIPQARGQGAQRVLFEARLQYAVEAGCDIAMVVVEPGSASQRNAERQGFLIAYTRIKWGRDYS